MSTCYPTNVVLPKVVADTRTVHIVVPLMHPIGSRFGGGAVHRAEWTGTGRAEWIGVEHIKLDSVYVWGEKDSDENHAWKAVEFTSVQDSWVVDVSVGISVQTVSMLVEKASP
jgi:hypothetical protein